MGSVRQNPIPMKFCSVMLILFAMCILSGIFAERIISELSIWSL